MSELLAYRIFITDFTLFTFYAHSPNYQSTKSIMMDEYVMKFWREGGPKASFHILHLISTHV